MFSQNLDQLSINTIRTLSMDAVQQAKSGHPGTPMALAPLVYTIWNRVMRFDPKDPIWPNRDRFILSNGHASMLLWSMLYLTGTRAVNAEYERLGQPAVTLDDIRRFRQLDSKAPGHPEYHWTSGVEATTGPLGQGVAMSVGMAIAEKWLANRYNRTGFDIFDYRIYAIGGDGCMMEGVASETASLAGHLQLDNLCWIYNNNHITIEGNTRIAFTEDIAARFLGYGWNVLRVGDANDIERIENALDIFRKTRIPPRLMASHSATTRFGSPSAATAGPRTRSSLCPTASTNIFPPASAREARKLGNNGPTSSPLIDPNMPSSRPRSSRCSGANSPPGGTATFLPSPPTPKASRDGTPQPRY